MKDATTTSYRQFRTSYIAIDKTFSQLRVDYFYRDTGLTNVTTGTGVRSYCGVFTLQIGSIDTTHKISIIPLLVGVNSNSVNG